MARALYIHWPFCAKKCPYCDFNSHVRTQIDHDLWRRALISDMQHEAALAGGEKLTSIFFGGGTPSLMPPSLVAALIAQAETLWGFTDDIEITLEANPSSVEAANFADLSSAGINRVSLGLQALDDRDLSFLGRLHNAAEGLAALDVAQGVFQRVSFDLIYARPGQSQSDWETELSRAIDFGTDHLSLYQLTIEPNTRFATDVRRNIFIPMANDPAADLFEVTRELTRSAVLPAYEVSNHARPGQESRHNLTYWRYYDYCGIGPGAHGRRGRAATLRHKKPENFLQAVATKGNGVQDERTLSLAECASEALVMGLRLAEGVKLRDLSDRFGFPTEQLIDNRKLANLAQLGLLWQEGQTTGVTERGMIVLDAVLAEIVHDDLVAA